MFRLFLGVRRKWTQHISSSKILARTCYDKEILRSFRMVHISASPPTALVDENVDILVSGLQPKQSITLSSMLKEKMVKYLAYAHFIADENGKVSTKWSRSVGGTYEGISCMGLFWSMRPKKGQGEGLRLFKTDVSVPFIVRLTVVDGHRTECDLTEEASSQLATLTVERWYKSPGVKRIEIKSGNIRGALFVPPGDGPSPGVIDMFGSAGGLIEYRAALLASRGFTVLALAFFNYDDLPKYMAGVTLDYFVEAVDWLSTHPLVARGGIGVVGVSFGGLMALFMASYCPALTACVSINSLDRNTIQDIKFRKTTIPFVEGGYDFIKETDEGVILREYEESHLKVDMEEAFAPVHKCDAKFLFIHGEDDQCCPPAAGENLMERLRSHGKDSQGELLIYPGAGHLIEPPHSPFCRTSYHKAFGRNFVWGGETVAHSMAQEHSWKKIIFFLKENTGAVKTKNISSKL